MSSPEYIWATALIKENPDLFRSIHDFNYRPAHWTHPARSGADAQAAVAQLLKQNVRALPRVNRHVSAALGLEDEAACWDFTEPRRRLALLPHESLAKLATFCGAALRWSRIATIIGRAQIVELKRAIGEHAHAFALRRGRLVVNQETASQSLPDLTLHEEIHTLGWQTVFSTLGGESPSLLKRFVLKLPEGITAPDFSTIDTETRDTAWKRARKVLAEVLTREEMRCFA